MAMRALRYAAMAALMVAVGCSSGGSNNDAAGGSSGGSSAGASGGGGATGGAGGGATNATCQALRMCALDNPDEVSFNSNCKSMGTTAAQAAFQALFECTTDPARGNCGSPVDINCLCMAQYLQDPPCADLLSACVGDINDLIAARCNG
jgi:hypothetical protein